MIQFEKSALDAIQQVYDNPKLNQLADRLEAVLTLLEESPGDIRVRKERMQSPKLWKIVVHGSSEVFTILWDDLDGPTWVRWAAMQDI